MEEGIYLPRWWAEKAAALKGAPARLAWGIVSLPGVASERGWVGSVNQAYASAGLETSGARWGAMAALVKAGLIEQTPSGLRVIGATPEIVEESTKTVDSQLKQLTDSTKTVESLLKQLSYSTKTVDDATKTVERSTVSGCPLPAREFPRTPDGRIKDDAYYYSPEGLAELDRMRDKYRAKINAYEDDDVKPIQQSDFAPVIRAAAKKARGQG